MASAAHILDSGRGPPGVGFDYVACLLGPDTTVRLIERIGLDALPGQPIDFVSAWKLLTANVALTADEGHQLAGAPVRPGNFELLMASMIQGTDLGDGLARLAAGATIIRPDLSVGLSHRHGALRLSVALGDSPSLAAEIYVEALVVVIHCAVRWAVGHPLAPVRVRGATALTQFGSSLLDVLAVKVDRQGCGAALTYAAEDAATPFDVGTFTRWHEASFSEYVRMVDQLEIDSTAVRAGGGDKLLSDVRNAILAGRSNQTALARSLGMSVPTLRRRLSEQRTSFRRICDDLRRSSAEMLLLSEKSLEDIAEELGMSDARCFRRACNGWFGRSPSELRRSMRDDVVR